MRASGFSRSFFVRATVSVFLSEISKPSSPVYPVRVSHTGLPAMDVSVNIPKYSLLRSMSVRGWSTSTALGPWNASRERSPWTINSQSLPLALNAFRCLLMCAWSFSLHAPLSTMYTSSSFTLVTTVSSMMPPLSLVTTERVPVPFFRPRMSPTTMDSTNSIASLPRMDEPSM